MIRGKRKFGDRGSGVHIAIQNLNKKYNIDSAFIKKITGQILKAVKIPRNIEIGIVFLDDDRIKRINKKFKHRDRATDVLSFPMEAEGFNSAKFFGDIFISLDTARKNSKKFGTVFGEEVTLYIIHGILHLFGYTDGTRRKRLAMSRKEKGILGDLCGREDLSKALMRR